MMVDASAAPACGPQGAAKVATASAAIETLRAGYERYIIMGSQAQSNVSVIQTPGTYNTSGTLTANRFGSFTTGTIQTRTTYTPGIPITVGTHDRSLQVIMFKPGDEGFEQALDAREQLGPEWPELVKNGIRTCL